MSITNQSLTQFLDEQLTPDQFQDYCPNGLQIEGSQTIERIAFAVSATRHSIEQAVDQQADALIVHHGLFWYFHGPKTLTGPFARRVLPLVHHKINLYGYHLPLDAHPTVGNAAVLGRLIGLVEQLPFGDYKGSPTGVHGRLTKPCRAAELQQRLEVSLDHNVMLASPDDQAMIKSVGIITGGANSDWILALQQGLDAYITGEMSEHDWHESQEAGIQMFAGGHHATEQFGIQSLMRTVEQHFKIECCYIDSKNPA